MKYYDLIVIGGGASGLIAAGRAAQLGCKVLLLEKMSDPGRKIFISGKGRCNLTNTAPIREFIEHFGRNGRFLRQAFHRFFNDDLVEFFGELGVPTITERGGRVFPKSENALDIVNALIRWNRDQGVEIRTNRTVRELILEEQCIAGVLLADGEFRAKHVLLATGGASYPGTGSTGDGYRFAEAVGHTIVPIRPGLVPIVTAGNTAKKCQGLSLRNVNVSIWVDGKKLASDFGEMLFTHFGLSGPIILSLSKIVVDQLAASRRVEVSIDLKPALDDKKLDARLLRDINQHGKKQFQSLLKSLLPQKLIPVCIEQTNIPAEKLCHQITGEERKRLRGWLKDFRFTAKGHRGFRQAIVTAGGVSLDEVNPRTMESKIVPGLHFAGEVLDLDADTGGYNLQAAFSTGMAAAQAVADIM